MNVKRIPMSRIHLDARQRSTLKNIDELAQSMKNMGQINPITVEFIPASQLYTIIAGERRFTAAQSLNWEHIIAQTLTDLTESQRQLIELEENVRRDDLPWLDRVKAVRQVADLLKSERNFTLVEIAEYVGMKPAAFSNHLRLAKALDNSKYADLATFSKFSVALHTLQRWEERKADVEAEGVNTVSTNLFADAGLMETSANALGLDADEITDLAAKPFSVISCDFNSWASSYTGERYNFIHCDFPPDTFWSLCKTLKESIDTICATNAHILLWFPFQHYTEIISFFQHTPITFNLHPIIWGKPDCANATPDPQRQPRRAYETALLGTIGDRKIAKVTNNFVLHSSEKRIHQYEKPVEMLTKLLTLLIDETSTILDPTCGSGSALTAARALHAHSGLGLELNSELAKEAHALLG